MRPNNWLTNSLSNLQLQASRRAQQCRRSASCQLAPLANNSNRAVKSVIRARKLIGALILVGIAATIAGAQYSESVSRPEAKKFDLTGTWLLTITPTGQDAGPSFPGLYTFTSDGITLFSSVGPPIPGLGNPGHGVWAKTGANTFAVTWKQFTFDDIFTTNGSLVDNSVLTSTGPDEFTASDMLKIFDLDGNVVLTLTGMVQAKRMKIEP
jgi:hypothetical protein